MLKLSLWRFGILKKKTFTQFDSKTKTMRKLRNKEAVFKATQVDNNRLFELMSREIYGAQRLVRKGLVACTHRKLRHCESNKQN